MSESLVIEYRLSQVEAEAENANALAVKNREQLILVDGPDGNNGKISELRGDVAELRSMLRDHRDEMRSVVTDAARSGAAQGSQGSTSLAHRAMPTAVGGGAVGVAYILVEVARHLLGG